MLYFLTKFSILCFVSVDILNRPLPKRYKTIKCRVTRRRDGGWKQLTPAYCIHYIEASRYGVKVHLLVRQLVLSHHLRLNGSTSPRFPPSDPPHVLFCMRLLKTKLTHKKKSCFLPNKNGTIVLRNNDPSPPVHPASIAEPPQLRTALSS